MLKKYLLLFLAILGGIAGIILRRWQLDVAFESETRLPISGTPATLAIALLSFLVVLLLFLLARSTQKNLCTKSHDLQTLPCRSFSLLLFLSVAALLTIVASVLLYQDALRDSPKNLLQLVFSLLNICSAVCLFLIGKQVYQGNSLKNRLILLIPAYSACFWLMVSYRTWARDPFIMDYLFALFAIVTTVLAHYFIASYFFAKPQPFMVFISTMLAVFFSIIALADSATLAEKCLLLAQVFYFSPSIFILCRNSGAGISDADSDHPLKEETT